MRLTYPAKLVEEARASSDEAADAAIGTETRRPRAAASGRNCARREPRRRRAELRDGLVDAVEGFVARLSDRGRAGRLRAGRRVAGAVLRDAPAWLQVPANALLGPLVAVLSFVCSIGNVPMAAVLWGRA